MGLEECRDMRDGAVGCSGGGIAGSVSTSSKLAVDLGSPLKLQYPLRFNAGRDACHIIHSSYHLASAPCTGALRESRQRNWMV